MAFGNGFCSSKKTCLLEKITRMQREIFIRRDMGKKKGHGGKFFVSWESAQLLTGSAFGAIAIATATIL